MTASIVGTVIYAVLYELGVPHYIDLWVVLAVVMGLRLASEYFGWTTPEASIAHEQMTAVGGTILTAPRRFYPGGTRRFEDPATGTTTDGTQVEPSPDLTDNQP
jgi:hypothetical protein